MASGEDGALELTYDEARERVLSAVRPLPPESRPLAECRGRPLRRALVAPHALPPFRNSSMDGFAVRAADVTPGAGLPVVATIAAGALPERPLGPGEAMRIMTGAPMPEGADAVVPFEASESSGPARARFARAVEPGENVREAGADVAAGETALAEGRELSPHDLALAAALGAAELPVGRRPRAVVISTGDELLELGAPLRPGAIYDSNRLLLALLLEEAGVTVVRASREPDDPARVANAIRAALALADVVLTVGGVSAGDFDPVKEGVAALGGIQRWRVAMKPGRPQAFGAPEGRLFFGLPGNPASVACTFEALVRPALRKLAGYSALERPRIEVRAAARIESRVGRVDFVRVTLEREGAGWRAREAGAPVSGHLAPQSRAHALLIVPSGRAAIEADEPAEAWVLRWPERA